MPRSRSRSPALRSAFSSSPNRKDRGRQRGTKSRSPDSSAKKRSTGNLGEGNRKRSSPYRSRRRSGSDSRPKHESLQEHRIKDGRKYSRSPMRQAKSNRLSRSPVRHHSPPAKESKRSSWQSRRKRQSGSPSPPSDARPSRSQRSRSPLSLHKSTIADREKGYADRKQLAKIKIIAPNLPNVNDDSDTNKRRRLERGICTLEEVLQLTEDGKVGVKGGTCFNSQEYETPSTKELRKIQIEIRRTIPRDRISTSPVRRSLRNPATVVFSRRPDEGITPIFDRDEIIHWLPDVPEQRVIAMVGDTPVERNLKSEPVLRRRVNRSTSRERRKSGTARSRSPAEIHAEGGSIRDRLGPASISEREESEYTGPDFKGDRKAEWKWLEEERQRRRSARKTEDINLPGISRTYADSESSKSDVKLRLGRRQVVGDKDLNLKASPKEDSALYDEDKVLDRDELERLRIVNANALRPWEVNPEIVPRGNYFEHDNRENDFPYSGGSSRGRGRGSSFERIGSGFRGRSRGIYGRGSGSGQGFQRGSGSSYRGNFRNVERDGGRRDSYGRDNYSNREGRYLDRRDDTKEGANRGYYQRYYGSKGGSSPNWKHDKYEEVVQMEEPTSTTNN